MGEWYRTPWVEVVKLLNSNINSGLNNEQVNLNRKKYGSNNILIPENRGIIFLAIKQLKELWTIMLLICFFALLYLKEFSTGFVALAIIILNCICMAVEEYNKEKGLKELQKLNIGYARVIRDDRMLKIPVSELVVGDIVIIGRGENVPADLRIVESENLKVNESSITGEEFISEKYETKIEGRELVLSEMKNILFKASKIVDGSGTGIVIATGMNTEIANITKLLLEERSEFSSLNKRISKLISFFAYFIILGLILIIGRCILYKENLNHIIRNSSTIILCALPIGMIVSITVANIVLLRGMKKKSIVFRDISTIERLSSISTICTDKIGAFSENKMETKKIYINNQLIDELNGLIPGNINENMYRLMSIALLCNDAKTNMTPLFNSEDDLVEVALVEFAIKNGLDKRSLEKKYDRILTIPFDTERRTMTTVNRVDKNYRANVKGSIDFIVPRCTHIMKNGIEMEMTEEDIITIKNAAINMSNECLSVIGFAYRNFNYEPSLKENIESNLVFVGLIGFENKLKEDIRDLIKKSKSLNIKPIMITEDNKLTALSVGKKIGLATRLKEILSGVEIDNMLDEEFERIIPNINIFSRISSSNKLKIIKMLKKYKYITMITGTKLTDLPALKNSDIGITNSKSNLVKKLSDVFLQDVSFIKLLDMIENSRKVVSILKKIIIYITSCSFSMLTFIIFIYIGRYQLSFIVEEALWFNIVIICLSALALIIQYENENTYFFWMLLDKGILKERLLFVILNGAFMGVGAFAIFILGYSRGVEFAQISSFATLNICAVIFNYRFSNKLLFKDTSSNLIIFINLLLQFLMLIIMDGSKVIYDVIYMRNVLIFVCIWFFICLFKKFEKTKQID